MTAPRKKNVSQKEAQSKKNVSQERIQKVEEGKERMRRGKHKKDVATFREKYVEVKEAIHDYNKRQKAYETKLIQRKKKKKDSSK